MRDDTWEGAGLRSMLGGLKRERKKSDKGREIGGAGAS